MNAEQWLNRHHEILTIEDMPRDHVRNCIITMQRRAEEFRLNEIEWLKSLPPTEETDSAIIHTQNQSPEMWLANNETYVSLQRQLERIRND